MSALLISDARTRWFVYRAGGLNSGVVWDPCSSVLHSIATQSANGIAPTVELLSRCHDLAFKAIQERTKWDGRGEHLCGAVRCDEDSVLAFAVTAGPREAYIASPIPLKWPALTEACPT